MVSLVAIVKVINRNNEAVRAIYELAGEVDACLSIAQLKTRTPGLCSPSFHQECMLHAACLSHPLVQCSIPNDLIWQDNILISGSNATGKSTFIKAVAVNVILAQTINLCYAHQFSLRRGQVMSAMAVRDNIVAGESYFIVEIKSLKRILDAMGDDLVYCFIDEILRGTNTIERISASSAVLRSMIGQEVLCMAATHDIELTRMLVDCYRNLHFGEIVNEAGVQFDYILKEGPTQTRNAIRLLSQMGYQPEVIAQAHENARRFETTGSWL
jgi:DNA mismatch repair ATPase MutS